MSGKKILLITLFYIVILLRQASGVCPGTVDFKITTNQCVGQTIDFHNLSDKVDSSFIWDWGDGSTPTVSNDEFQYHTYAVAQKYTVKLTGLGKAPARCYYAITKVVEVYTSPAVPQFTFKNNAACGPIEISFDVSAPFESSYLWNFGDPRSTTNSSTDRKVIHKFNPGPGAANVPYTVTLQAISSNGCISSASNIITAKQKLKSHLMDVGGSFTNCTVGKPYDLQVSDTSNANLIKDYYIDWGDNSGGSHPSKVNKIPHKYTGSGDFKLLYLVKGLNDCVDSSTIVVSNSSVPTVKATIPNKTGDGCAPNAISFLIEDIQFKDTNIVYFINYGDGTDVVHTKFKKATETLTHTYLKSSCSGNSFIFSIAAKNKCDSIVSSVGGILVYAKPNAEFNVPTAVCIGSEMLFENTSTLGYNAGTCSRNTTFTWDFGDGSVPVTYESVTDATKAHGKHIYRTAGVYPVRLDASSPAAGQCGFTTKTQEIHVYDVPKVQTTASLITSCKGVPATLSATGDAVTYEWHPAKYLETPKAATTTAKPLETTEYIVIGTSAHQCTDTGRVMLKILPLPDLDLKPKKGSICKDSTLTLSASVTTADPNVTYSWSPVAGLNQFTGDLVKATPPTSTNYVVTATGTNTCIKKDTVSIIVNELPAVSITGDNRICSGDTTLLTAHGATTYFWTPVNSLKTASGSTALVSPSVLTSYNVMGVDMHGCKNKANFPVDLKALPSLNVSPIPDTTICSGSLATLSATGNGVSYQWTASQNFKGETGAKISVKPSSSTTYKVISSSTEGCHKTAIVAVNVNPLPVGFGTVTKMICQGGSITLGSAGLTGHSYQWLQPKTGFSSMLANPSVQPDTSTSYYLKETIDATKCVNFDTVNVKVNVNAAINILPYKEKICSEDSFIVSIKADIPGTIIKWTVKADASILGAKDGQGDQIKQKIINTGSQPKIVVYTVNYSSGQCVSHPVTVSVKVFPLLNVKAGDALSATCQNIGIYKLEGASPAGGIWSGKGVIDSLKGLVDPQITGPGSYVLTYRIPDTTESVCPLSATKKLSVFEKPTAAFALDTIGCKNDSIKIAQNSSVKAIQYKWDFGDGKIETEILPFHIYKDTLNATVTLIAISADACSDTATSLIKIREVPTLKIVTSPKAGCEPLSVKFNNQSKGYNAVYTWALFQGSDYTGYVPPDFTFKAGTGGDTLYPIQVNASNFCGTTTFKDTISVAAFPKSNFRLSQNTGCSPLQISFSNLTPGQPKIFSWNFMDGTAKFSGATPSPHIFKTGLKDTLYNITLIATNQCGTDSMIQKLLLHTNNVHAFINTDVDKGCEPFKVQFNNFSTGQTSASWDFGDNTTLVGNEVNHVFSAGVYKVKLYADNKCSFDTAVKKIVVHPKPILNLNLSKDSFCLGEKIIFTNTVNTLATHSWQFGNGDSSNALTPSYAFQKAGNYVVAFSARSDSFSCKNTITKNIKITPLPIADFTLSDSIGCQPLTVDFVPRDHNLSYKWAFGDGKSSISSLPQNVYNDAGYYTVHLEVQNATKCMAQLDKRLTVKAKPNISFEAGKQSSCQFPLPVSFENKSTHTDSFIWHFGNGTSSTIDNPKTIYKNPGQYHVVLVGRNIEGCIDSLEKTVSSSAPVKAAFTVSDSVGCLPLLIKFKNTSSVNTIKSTWYFGDDAISLEKDAKHTYQKAGNYTVSLKVNSEYCADSIAYPAPVKILHQPKADFHYLDSDDPSKGRIQLTNTSLYGSTYKWNFGDGGLSSDNNPLHTFANSGLHRVVLYASNKYCQDSSVKMIQVSQIKSLFIPNAFTPESGSDEVRKFTPKGKGLKSYHISIFNLWGTMIWESSALQDGSPSESWNGYYHDVLSPQDAYVWKVEAVFLDGSVWQGQKIDGDIRTTGTVTLLK